MPFSFWVRLSQESPVEEEPGTLLVGPVEDQADDLEVGDVVSVPLADGRRIEAVCRLFPLVRLVDGDTDWVRVVVWGEFSDQVLVGGLVLKQGSSHEPAN